MEFNEFSDTTTAYAAPATTGSRARKIKIYNASIAGQTWQYHADTARREALLRLSSVPDLILFSLGDYENATKTQAATWFATRQGCWHTTT